MVTVKWTWTETPSHSQSYVCTWRKQRQNRFSYTVPTCYGQSGGACVIASPHLYSVPPRHGHTGKSRSAFNSSLKQDLISSILPSMWEKVSHSKIHNNSFKIYYDQPWNTIYFMENLQKKVKGNLTVSPQNTLNFDNFLIYVPVNPIFHD